MFRKIIVLSFVILSFTACEQNVDFEIHKNKDPFGGDYKTLDNMNNDVKNCIAACKKEAQCKAFTFSTVSGTCWLKQEVSDLKDSNDVICGIKKQK